ncbi:hypothetical protein APSETT444_006856 [Aspergillus pseudonomiae]
MSSSIPSTTSVFQKLNQQISTPATVSACLQAVSLLSEAERKVLVESPAKYHITPTDKEAFTTAAVRALSSDDLDQELGEAASGASDAVNGILELMVGLIINLAWGDSMNGTHLTEQYEPIMRLYCKTMRDGIPLANTIAQYAEDVPLDVQIPALRVALESPFGPYVMIAGLLGVANPEATIAAYSIAASMTNQEYVPITTVISDLATQGQSGSAEDTNTEYFNEFREHIGVLAGYWGSTLIDAREIESWLKMGASLVTSQIPWDHWVNADENS